MQRSISLCVSMGVVGVAAGSCLAQYDLQITEIWPGNQPGDNLTEDWFELTNLGDAAWVAAVDGDLWYDDESFDPGDAALISGVGSIAPGQSVIFVNGGVGGATEWSALWDDVVILPQVGSFDGAGLSQGGDAVAVWISMGMPVDGPYTTASYPDANATGGQSYDTVLGEFSTVGNAAGAVATIILNDEGQPAIGSPGAIIPAPGAAALGLVGIAAMTRCRR